MKNPFYGVQKGNIGLKYVNELFDTNPIYFSTKCVSSYYQTKFQDLIKFNGTSFRNVSITKYFMFDC